MLLRAGADVNSVVDGSGYKPLNDAVRLEGAISITISNMLLSAGADVDGGNYPPLWNACQSRTPMLFDLLLEHVANPTP